MAIVKKTQNVGKDVRKGDTYIVGRNETGRATVENCMEIPKKKKICLQCRRPRFGPWVGRMPWRRK